MKNTIQRLTPQLANQIAAGEVVERPSSVVKELLENSLDAGATHIHIDINKGGSQLIRIRDNGYGIAKDQLDLALSRHATSKISALSDLEAVASLGFRGEALASISSVSHCFISSKPREQETAWKVTAQGRDMAVSIEPTSHPDGTTVEVQDLFFNTPARRKFLRTEKTEFTHLEDVVKRIALSRFDVALQLTHNQHPIFQLPVADSAARQDHRVAKLCGKAFIQQALRVDLSATGLHLWGWLGLPRACRKQGDRQFFFINGRMVKDKLVNHAIRQAYREHLTEGDYPAYVLYLECDPATVDVNVHPTKAEVRFREGRLIHDFIFSKLHQVLMGETETLALQDTDSAGDSTSSFATPMQHGENTTSRLKFEKHKQQGPSKINRSLQAYQQLTRLAQPDEKTKTAELSKPSFCAESIAVNAQESAVLPNKATKRQPFGVIIGLYKRRYLLMEHEQGLGLIHIRHAQGSILQAQLQQQLDQNTTDSRPLMFPATIRLDEPDLDGLYDLVDKFRALGITMDRLGPENLVVRGLPSWLASIDPLAFVKSLALSKLIKDLSMAQIIEKVAMAATPLLPVPDKLMTQQQLVTQLSQHDLESVPGVYSVISEANLPAYD